MHRDHSPHAGILDALPPKTRAEVMKNARTRRYAAGDVLVEEGDGAMYLFIIDSGHARIERAGTGTVGRFGPGTSSASWPSSTRRTGPRRSPPRTTWSAT